MKMIFGAIALALAVPAIGHSVPAADLQADRPSCHAAQTRQDGKGGVYEMHKACRAMKGHSAKAHRREKTEAERLDAEVNGNGHQGHNH